MIATGVSHSVRELVEIAFGTPASTGSKHVTARSGAASGPPKSTT